MSKPSLSEKQSQESAELKLLNLNAAGLDIGAEEIYACVPSDRDERPIRSFGTYTAELKMLADWLQACGIETVAMESTGVYWVPVYQVLEERGIAVSLVNARHLKNVPGRNTDVTACQWLQQLHTYGLLRASFRPDEEICTLRALVRQRQELVCSRSRQIQLMQKSMEQMNVKLTEVVSDITGVTGISIIRAIVQGERDPKQLAQLRNPKCKKSEEEIALALEGTFQIRASFCLASGTGHL